MEVRIVACGIFQLELEKALEDFKAEGTNAAFNISYTPPALHVDYMKLKDGISEALNRNPSGDRIVLIFGSMCHPEMSEFTADYQVIKLKPRNCIELILGKDRLEEIEKSAKVFYLTQGWLKNWRDIFQQGQGWDEIDARQNFGFYEKILLLDTGVSEFDAEDILEFFEYTQVPIEIETVDLTIFKMNIAEAIEQVLKEVSPNLLTQ